MDDRELRQRIDDTLERLARRSWRRRLALAAAGGAAAGLISLADGGQAARAAGTDAAAVDARSDAGDADADTLPIVPEYAVAIYSVEVPGCGG